MAAGICAVDDYYLGERPLQPTVSNPKGYFEDADINSINNSLIYLMLKWPFCERVRKKVAIPPHRDMRLYPSATFRRVPSISIPSDISSEMRSATAKVPFLFKDPRFSATWRYWLPLLPSETQFLVIFREPEKVAESYVLNAKRIYGINLDAYWPLRSFSITYKRLMREFQHNPNALFVHYDQIYSGERLLEIARRLDVSLNSSHVGDPKLRRSEGILPRNRILEQARKVYAELCRAANFDRTVPIRPS